MKYQDFLIMILIFLGFFGYIFFRIHLLVVRGKKNQYHNDSIDITKINKNISELVQIDPNFTESNLVNKAYSLYEKFQYAWTNADDYSLKVVLNDELYKNYSFQISEQKRLHEKNIIKDIEYLNGKLLGFTNTKNTLNVYVELEVKLIDYIIDETTNEIVVGEDIPTTYKYKLVISRDKKDSKSSVESFVISKIRNLEGD